MRTEQSLRKDAQKQGLQLTKSRSRNGADPAFGLFSLTDLESGGTIHENHAGQPFALTLEDVDEILREAAA